MAGGLPSARTLSRHAHFEEEVLHVPHSEREDRPVRPSGGLGGVPSGLELAYSRRVVLAAQGGQTYHFQLNAEGYGAAYTFDLQNSLPPTVGIVYPRVTDVIRGVSSFKIVARVSDPQGAVRQVEFTYDYQKVGVVSSPPYEWGIPVKDSSPPGHYVQVDACHSEWRRGLSGPASER